MARKVFLSFLGANNYIQCNYQIGCYVKVDSTKYVQEAVIRTIKEQMKVKIDKIFIFATQRAEEMNWEVKDGLESVLERTGISYELVRVPNGFNNKEVYDMFKIIYDKLEVDDDVYFDVTHSFRFMPMLVIPLLNYSKFLKKTNIVKIYYGAFEYLGPSKDVEKMELKDRNAPVLELEWLADMLDWSSASDDFVNYGITEKLADLLKLQHKNKETSYYKRLSDVINTVANSITSVRGRAIMELDSNSYVKTETLPDSEVKSIIEPIFNKIKDKINVFSKVNGTYNIFEAVKWCVEHNLTQQGYTLLKEGILTYILNNIMNENYLEQENRKVLSSYLNMLDKPQEWGPPLKDEKGEQITAFASKCIKYNEKIKPFSCVFINITGLRNSMNHADMQPEKGSDSDKLKKQLKTFFDEVNRIISVK